MPSGVQGLLDKVSGNFVAAFIPSLAFVTVAMVAFAPIFPPRVLERLQTPFFEQPGLLLLVMTLVLGFTLSSLNTFIYKLFEGYILLEGLQFLKQRQRIKAKRTRAQIEKRKKMLSRLEDRGVQSQRVQQLKEEQQRLAAIYQQEFPTLDTLVLPTRFGNIFRAAEDYSGDRYGIDSVAIWPRLIHVIPPSYYDKVESSNNGLAFLINCSLLSLLLALLCVLASSYQYLVLQLKNAGFTEVLYFLPINLESKIYSQRIMLYLVGCAIMIVCFFFFYRATLPVAQQYVALLRSTFDLFRFDLLRQLRIAPPEDSPSERDKWRKISEFITRGDSFGPLHFDYQVSNGAGQESGSKLGSIDSSVQS